MNLLECQITDHWQRYNKLRFILENWNDRLLLTSRKSGLTQEEIKSLKNDLKVQQHEYFLKWHNMNKCLREKGLPHYLPQKERDLGSMIIGVVRYTDVLSA